MTSPPRTARPRREDLVEAAIGLLRAEGPAALQVRRVAAEAGVTTIVVYRRFGGMPGLVSAVVDAGFDRLAEAFSRQAGHADPVTGLCALAGTYRDIARADPYLFDLMFGLSNPAGYRPGPWPVERDGSAAGRGGPFARAYRPLVDYATRAIELGYLRAADPESVAAQLWSYSHGFVVLELAGHFAGFADPYAEVFVPMAVNLVVGLGDTREHASAALGAAAGG